MVSYNELMQAIEMYEAERRRYETLFKQYERNLKYNVNLQRQVNELEQKVREYTTFSKN
jgi:chromosome segregation ATPase